MTKRISQHSVGGGFDKLILSDEPKQSPLGFDMRWCTECGMAQAANGLYNGKNYSEKWGTITEGTGRCSKVYEGLK